MRLPENIIEFIKQEASRIHHGKIIIELNESSDKIDVVVESRERFHPGEKEKEKISR